jgi:PAS domain S-box-containing protein
MDFLFRSEVSDAIRDMVPTIIADLDTGEILEASEPAERMLGYQVRGELVGMNVDDLVPGPVSRRELHAQHRAGFAINPKPRRMGNGELLAGLHKAGHEVPIVIGLYPTMISGRRCVIAALVNMSEEAGKPHEDKA